MADIVADRLAHASATPALELVTSASDTGDAADAGTQVAAAHNREGSNRGQKAETPGTVVRGGFVNDVSCVPLDGGQSGDGYQVECTGGSWWNGDFNGRAIVYWKGYVSPRFEIDAPYDETFVGTYAGDESTGGLRLKGRFTLDANGAFSAHAQIVEGSCSWLGSAGSMTYHGYQANGGYIGSWSRPDQAAPSNPTCDPTMLPFDPASRVNVPGS